MSMELVFPADKRCSIYRQSSQLKLNTQDWFICVFCSDQSFYYLLKLKHIDYDELYKDYYGNGKDNAWKIDYVEA